MAVTGMNQIHRYSTCIILPLLRAANRSQFADKVFPVSWSKIHMRHVLTLEIEVSGESV